MYESGRGCMASPLTGVLYGVPVSGHVTAARWTQQPFLNPLSRFRECCTRWVWLVPYGCL